jgi:hypothetical protein
MFKALRALRGSDATDTTGRQKHGGSRVTRILSVSDVVSAEFAAPDFAATHPGIDLILSCGDLPPEYLTSLAAGFNVPLYYVCGNHDIRYGNKPPAGCTDLHARLVRFRGLNILGLAGSRWYNGGPHQYTEAQMRRTIRGLRIALWRQGGVDLVFTHAPPRHVHDAEDRCHKGFRCFNALIERYAPRWFVHGHIHRNFSSSAERETVVRSNTRVVNSYGHFVFEIDSRPDRR